MLCWNSFLTVCANIIQYTRKAFARAGGLNATPESFFPTLPSLSLLVEDAAEGFSSLFSRSSPDMRGACDDADADANPGATSCLNLLTGICLHLL